MSGHPVQSRSPVRGLPATASEEVVPGVKTASRSLPHPAGVTEATPVGLVRWLPREHPVSRLLARCAIRTRPFRAEALSDNPSETEVPSGDPIWSRSPIRVELPLGCSVPSPIPPKRSRFGPSLGANSVRNRSSSRGRPGEPGPWDTSSGPKPVRGRRRESRLPSGSAEASPSGPHRDPKAPLGNCKVRHESPARQPGSVPKFREASRVFARTGFARVRGVELHRCGFRHSGSV